ncbi:MAG: enoyl-CoA hydratase/isomerase family protein [Thermoleophilaceae bacterium]|nr:enoyl-CoA hydratase/isomerase family protein [Thermoleophilaceae bacterium]
MSSLDRDGNVFVLNLGDDENRYNPDSVSALNAHLDEVEAASSPRALVVVGSGKIWSNGLDLEWMGGNVESVPAFINEVHELLARALEFPVPTIAALNGHTFAAGAMLAIAFDERIMREDRGYYCLPEVDIRIPFTPGMDALMKARLKPQVAHEAMTTGKRYTAAEAVEAEIVQAAVAEDQVLPAAIERAGTLTEKDGTTLGIIKQRLYAPALATLRDREANKLPGLGD